jgi:predicted Fe-S protein YdhL (DUF1289 family)
MDKGLCLGCHRTIDEIAGWSAASDEEKRAILMRVAERAGAADSSTGSALGAALRSS